MPPRGQSEEAITTAIAFCRRKLRGLLKLLLQHGPAHHDIFEMLQQANRKMPGNVLLNYKYSRRVDLFQESCRILRAKRTILPVQVPNSDASLFSYKNLIKKFDRRKI